MTVFLRLFSVTALILAAGCSFHKTIVIRKSIVPPDNLVLVGSPDMEEGDERRITSGLKYYESPRYLVTAGSGAAVSLILEAGARETTEGNLFEAEVLFLELRGKETSGSVENNLGVVYEKSGKYAEAFSMYMSALRLDPENDLYRKNLYYFITSGGLLQKKGTEKKRN